MTGDLKDFGRFMNRHEETLGIRIQTVADFLDQVGWPEHRHYGRANARMVLDAITAMYCVLLTS